MSADGSQGLRWLCWRCWLFGLTHTATAAKMENGNMRKPIASAPMMCASARTMRAATLLSILAMSTTGCAVTAGSETERAICRELGASLPSWSSADTVQSRTEGAEFLDVFNAVCAYEIN